MRDSRPNIILITTDQQRYDSVRLNGSAFMHTPNQDRLGTEGAVFRRAYCPSTVCTPSRVSMMTGLHLSRHGAYNIGTTAGDYSLFLSSILRREGYRTHHIGKAHWHPYWAPSPENRPVDEDGNPYRDFAGFETAEVCIGHGTFGVTGHYAHWVRRKGFDPETLRVKHLFDKEPEVPKSFEVTRKSPPTPLQNDPNETGDWNLPLPLHQGHWVAERAVDFLKNRDQDRPFFLNLGFQDPHHPHVLPEDFKNRVDPEAIPLPDIDLQTETDLPEHLRLLQEGGIAESRFNGRFVMAGNVKNAWKPYFQDEQKTRLTRAYYYSMVQLFDEQLGIILDAVDQLNLREDTWIIVTSDHGEMLGDHAIGQKGPMIYEGVTHIPMFMRYPAGFAPCVVEECVSLVDLLPTILDFIGIADPARRDGISLKARLTRGTPLAREGVRVEFKEEPDRIRFKCYVTPDWKIGVYPGESFGELYDLRKDPGEKCNLFHLPEYQSVKAQLLLGMLEDMERSEPLSPRPCRA